jgi:thiol-disulfide isomerase/thioredoxin
MLSRLNFKRIRILLLIMALLILASACSDLMKLQDGKTQDPPAIDDLSSSKDDKVDEPGDSGDIQTYPEIDESDAGVNSEADPEKILEGYYYSKMGTEIMDFELEDLNGNKVRLSDFKGKIVFLNFWATWCPPCRHEMPFMQELYEKYKDDLVILAVNPSGTENRGMGDSQKAEETVRQFIEEEGYTFPVLLDRDDSVWGMYRQRGIPANYMIDREGIIKYLKPGAFMSLEELEAFAKALGVADVD